VISAWARPPYRRERERLERPHSKIPPPARLERGVPAKPPTGDPIPAAVCRRLGEHPRDTRDAKLAKLPPSVDSTAADVVTSALLVLRVRIPSSHAGLGRDRSAEPARHLSTSIDFGGDDRRSNLPSTHSTDCHPPSSRAWRSGETIDRRANASR
jgi:hypothetical protein